MAALIIQFFSGEEKNQIINAEKHFEEVLRIKEQRLQKLLEIVLNEKHDNTLLNPSYAIYQADLWQEEGLSVFLYRNDSLVYWSNNNVPADIIYNEKLFSQPFIHYGNGWFRVIKSEKKKT